MIFPSDNPDVIKSWFKKLINSEFYGENKDKLESLSSRFFGNPQLTSLVITLNKIKKMPYTESEKEQHEKDIQKLIEKISLYIKRRLTDIDVEILDQLSSEINHVAEKISEKMNSDVESLMSVEVEEPPVEEKPEEKKVSERMRNKLKKKIKEIVRTNLINAKYR
jgi:macrodomain Ter protein organizer (MatP/YcbG family)